MKRYPDKVKYRPLNPDKYVGDINEITMRSSWESKLAFFLDTNTSIIKWGSEIQAIKYYSTVDKKERRYYPDFWAIIKHNDGSEEKVIVEVKPSIQTKPPKLGKNKKRNLEMLQQWQLNQDKWQAASLFAKKHNFRFLIMDEYSLGIKK